MGPFTQKAHNLEPRTYFRITREAQNFFKHAKKDADSVLELDAKDREALGVSVQ